MHIIRGLINDDPAVGLAALGLFVLFAAILIVRAVRKYREGDRDFDPLATADQPARRALDNKPWWKNLRTMEPRPSDEGTGTPREARPCAACGRHFAYGGCDTCKAHGWSEFLPIKPYDPGADTLSPLPYNPATDVSHSNIGPGVDNSDTLLCECGNRFHSQYGLGHEGLREAGDLGWTATATSQPMCSECSDKEEQARQ